MNKTIIYLALLFSIGIITSCGTTKTVYYSVNNSNEKEVIENGDITVYRKRIVSTDFNGKSGNVDYIYSIQKSGGEVLAMNTKNIRSLVDGFLPTINLLNTIDARKSKEKVWGTINISAVGAGIVLIGIGASQGGKGTGVGGEKIVGGFALALSTIFSYMPLKKHKAKTESLLLESIKLYNSRSKNK